MQIRQIFDTFARNFLAVTALSISVFAGADNCNYPDTHCVSACAPSCGDNCCGTPCLPPPVCAWGYNPPAYARCGCETACQNSFFDSFTFRADFLWWRACEEGLLLGSEELVRTFQESPTPVRNIVINTSRTRKPDFKYDPGFRLGLSNNCLCDCWDFAVNWTSFHTKASVIGTTDVANGITFISDWERIIGVNPLTSEGRYTLNLDLVDLEFGRKFYTSSCFVLRPQFGLRFARINQNYRIKSELNANPESLLITFASDVKSRSNFLAIGPRVGLDVELDIGCGLVLFGEAAGAIVFGKFDNHARERLQNYATVGSSIGTFEYEANSSAQRNSRTFTDIVIGFKWDRCFQWCNRCHPVSIAFVWEHHAFYDMNNFDFAARGVELIDGASVAPTGTAARKQGDLYTQGLTLSATFGF